MSRVAFYSDFLWCFGVWTQHWTKWIKFDNIHINRILVNEETHLTCWTCETGLDRTRWTERFRDIAPELLDPALGDDQTQLNLNSSARLRIHRH